MQRGLAGSEGVAVIGAAVDWRLLNPQSGTAATFQRGGQKSRIPDAAAGHTNAGRTERP